MCGWIEGINHFAKTLDLQLELREKLVHFSKKLK